MAIYPLISVSKTGAGPKLNIANSQSTLTQAGLQVMWQVPISTLQARFAQLNTNLNSSLSNLRFVYNNQFVLAWLESINNGTATIWIKMPVSIPANSSITLNLYANPGLNFDGVYWGEAPQLSTTYAEYDNGASVFLYYQGWGGLSALPSGWSSLSGTVINYASTYTEIAPSSTVGNWYGIYLNPIPSSLSSTTTIWEFYGNMYDSVGAGNCVGVGPWSGGNGGENGYSFFEGASPPNLIYLGNNGGVNGSTGYNDTNNNKVYTMQMNSATSLQMFINYQQIYSTTSATSEAGNLTYFNISPGNNGGSLPSTPIYVYWLRTRAYSPNGVMPTVELM